jgi:hypothetical protein
VEEAGRKIFELVSLTILSSNGAYKVDGEGGGWEMNPTDGSCLQHAVKMGPCPDSGVILFVTDGESKNEPTQEEIKRPSVDMTYAEVLEVRKRRGGEREKDRDRARERMRGREGERKGGVGGGER